MFNPATTSEERDLGTGSPTRNRCIKIAKDEDYGTLTEVNLFAYRAPAEMLCTKRSRKRKLMRWDRKMTG